MKVFLLGVTAACGVFGIIWWVSVRATFRAVG